MKMTEHAIVATLRELIKLDYVAELACATASEQVANLELRELLARLKTDHQRHIEVLATILANYDDSPPLDTDVKNLKEQNKVALAPGMSERVVLETLMQMEARVADAYATANTDFEGFDEFRAVIAEYLLDETAHRNWLEDQLVAREPGT